MRLNVVAARAGRGSPGTLEDASGLAVGYRADGTILVAVDPSDRAVRSTTCSASSSSSASTPGASPPPRAVPSSRSWPRGSGAAPSSADDHQVDNRRAVGALVEACRRRGVRMVADEVAAVTTSGRSGLRRHPPGRRGPGGRHRRPGRRQPVRAARRRSRRLPPPGPAGQGAHPPAAGPGPRTRPHPHGAGTGPRPHLPTWSPVGTAAWWWAPPSRRRGSTPPSRPDAVHDLLADARALVPALDEYELVEMTTGCARGPRTTPPSWAGHRSTGWWWPPATTATASCWRRSPPRRWRHSSGGEDVPGPMAPFGPGRFPTAVPGAPVPA